jgi:hypothetical protein
MLYLVMKCFSEVPVQVMNQHEQAAPPGSKAHIVTYTDQNTPITHKDSRT